MKGDTLLRKSAGEGQNRADGAGRQSRQYDARSPREHLERVGGASDDFDHALDHSRTVLYADDIGMFGEREDLRRFERDASELRDGIEQDRDRRRIGHGAVVSQKDFGFVNGFVVIRRFHQGSVIAEVGGAFGASDGFGRRFRARSGEEAL